jgi:hypothetical protein
MFTIFILSIISTLWYNLSVINSRMLKRNEAMDTPLAQRIQFEFVDYGIAAPDSLDASNCLYLDVGGELRIGVIDHHQFPTFKGSATKLAKENPELIRKAINPNDQNSPIRIIVHNNPDLDAVASAAMAIEILTGNPDDVATFRLSEYVNRVDSGRQGADRNNPYSLYSAFAQLLQNIAEQTSPEEMADLTEHKQACWNEAMKKGIQLVNYVLSKSREKDLSIEDIDAFSCPRCLQETRDRQYVKGDLMRYEAKLNTPETKARTIDLNLFSPEGKPKQTKGLLVRNVQGEKDPNRVMFFKDWARTDSKRNPDDNGFRFLSVVEENAINGHTQAWISIRPEDDLFSLIGLGPKLEEAEANKRIALYGLDKRWQDPDTGETKKVRYGYDNPDPWYDGRGHDFTMISTPNSGTALSTDEIEAIIVDYGCGKSIESLYNQMPDPEKLIEFDPDSDSAKEQKDKETELKAETIILDICFRDASKTGKQVTKKRKDIFISYPRTKLEWVKNNLLPRIKEICPEDQIFFDMNLLKSDASWLRDLGLGVQNAKVFIPVLCSDYDRSPWCCWEYEIAQICCIDQKTPIVMPVCMEKIQLPVYLKVNHAYNTWLDEWPNKLLADLEDLISK